MAVSKAELDLIISLRDEASANMAKLRAQVQSVGGPLAAAAQAAQSAGAAFSSFGSAAMRAAGFGSKIRSEAEQAKEGLDKASEAAEKTKESVGKLPQKVPMDFSGLASLSQQLSAVGQRAQGIPSIFSSVGGALASTASTVISATATFAAFSAAAAGGAAALGVSMNASAEQTQTAFTTILGSAQTATAYLGELRDFSAKTPFEFPQVAQAAQLLLAVGVNAKAVIPIMTGVGDAIGALGGGAQDVNDVVTSMQKMLAVGKATNEDLLELAGKGIPVYQILGQAFGKTTGEIQDMASQGLIPAGAAIDALVKGMEGMYGGAMAAQSATFNGLLSTLKDNASNALMAFTGPLFSQAKSALDALGQAVASPAFQQFAATMGERVGQAMTAVVAALQPAASAAVAFGQAIAAGQNPLESLFAALEQLLPGLGAFAQEAYTYGAQIVGQLAAGMQQALGVIVGIMNQIGAILAEWLQPHSPPKVAPALDTWGTDAATVYFDAFAQGDTSGVAAMGASIQSIIDQVPADAGLAQAGQEAAQTYLSAWSSADYGALDDLSNVIQSTLKSLQSTGAVSETDVIPRVLGSQGAIKTAIDQMKATGDVSEDALGRIVDAAGPAGQTVRSFAQSYFGLQKATQAVASAQQQLNRVTSEYDARLKPMNADLKKTQDQKQAIDDQIRVRDLQKQIASGKLDDLEKQRAQLEIQQIQQEAAIRGVEDQKSAATDQAQAQLDAAKAAQDAAKAQMDAQKAAIDAYNSQNQLMGEQVALLQRIAKEQEAAAKRGAGGGKGKKGGGIPIPDVKNPGLDLASPLKDLGTQIDQAKQRFVDFKDQVTGGFTQAQATVSPIITNLRTGFATLQQVLAPLVPIVAGIVAGFAAFGALAGIASIVGGIGAGFVAITANGTGLMTVLGTIVGLLGGPVTIAVVGAAAAIGLFAAAWAGNWGNIQGVMAPVVAAIQPVLANLQTQFSQLVTNLQPGFAQLTAAIQQMSPIFTAIAAVVGGVLLAALAGLGGALPGIGQAFSGLMQVIAGVTNLISSQIMGMVSIVTSLLSGDWQGAWNAAVTMVQSGADALGQIFGGLLGIATGFINSLIGGLTSQFGTLVTMVSGKAEEMGKGFVDSVTKLPGQAATAMAPLVESANKAIQDFNKAVQDKIAEVSGIVTTALNNAKTAMDGLGNSFKDAGGALIGNFVQGIKDAAGRAVQAAKDVVQSVRNILPGSEPKDKSSPLVNLGHSGQAMMENFAAGIPDGGASAIVATRNAAKGVAAALSDAFSSDATFLRAKAEAQASFAELVPDPKALESVNSQIERATAQLASGRLNSGQQAGTEARLNYLYAKRAEMLKATQTATTELAAAQQQAQQIAQQDPQLANDYYNLRIKQIKEIADLQKQQAEAKTQYEKNALEQQIKDLGAAQAAELAAFQQHLADVAQAAQQAAQDMADQLSSTVEDLVNQMRDSTATLYRDQASAIRDLQDLYPDTTQVQSAAQAITDAQKAVADYDQKRADIEAQIAAAQITAAQNDDPAKRADAAEQILELQKQLSDLQTSDGAEAAQQLAAAQKTYDDLISQQAQMASIAQQAQQQIAQAQQQAQQLDPAIADDFYKMRVDQIMELAKLQEEMVSAQSDAERAAIQQQIALIQQAQGIEQQAFQDQIKNQAAAVSDAQKQIQDLINQYGSSMSASTLAELQNLQKQLAFGSAGLPTQPTIPPYMTRGPSVPTQPTAAGLYGSSVPTAAPIADSGTTVMITFAAGAVSLQGTSISEAQVERLIESAVNKAATSAFQRNRTK